MDDLGAGSFAFTDRHAHLAGDAALLAALLAQIAQPRHAPLVALAPRRDAVAHPVLLHRDATVELVPVALFFLQDRIAPRFEFAEAALEAARLPTIEPHGGARQPLKEAPVMADQHERRAHRAEFGFQPLDRRQVEMVRRLVEQQDIGRRREDARECRAPRFAAGKLIRCLRPVEAQIFQQIPRPIGIVARRQSGFDERQGRCKPAEVGLLRQIADRRPRRRRPRAAIDLDQSCGDLQQGRFTRTVAPDEAQPLALAQRQIRALEQRRAPEGQMNVLKLDQRRGHARFVALRRYAREEAFIPLACRPAAR